MKIPSSLLAAFFAFAATQSAWADEVVDLGGESVSVDGSGFKSAYNGKTIENGTVTVTQFDTNTGTYTIGSGAVVTCGVQQYFNGNYTISIVNGGEYRQTDSYFTLPFRYGAEVLTLDGGKLISTSTSSAVTRGGIINFGYVWNNQNSTKDKDISAVVVMKNNSTISLDSGNLQLSSSKSNNEKGTPLHTTKTDLFVTNSTIVVAKGQIVLGNSYDKWIGDEANSYVRAVFGPGSEITTGQIYADGAYPTPSVTFDGATIHWNGNNTSFIGHRNTVGDIYEIKSGGLTVDIPSGKSLTCDSHASSLKGAGGITKIGSGSIAWNRVSSNGSQGMTFTGPLVVSNGTWSSSLSYAATSFAVDGANSTLALSGTFTASAPDMSVTQGGTLVLRSGSVAARTVGALVLGEGAKLAVIGSDLGVDSFSASSLDLSATTANPVALEFSDAASIPGGTYNIITITGGGTFAAGDESKFALDANAPAGSSLSVSGASLVLTVPLTNPATWTGGANDGKFSTPGNWLGNAVPGASDDVVISAASETTLDCDVALNVNSISFPSSSAKVTIDGEGSIACATTIVNGSAARPVIGVPVEFVVSDAYAPIDVTGEVDFQGGVKGTLPANHTKFYGNYTLMATSWTLSSAITLAENATVTATGMEMHPNGKLLNAEIGSKLKLKQLSFDKDVKGNVFGTYKGELDVNTFYTYYPNGAFSFNSGFAGLLRVGYFHNYTAGVRSDVNFTPASSATIVIGGTGLESQTGWLKLGSFVARSSGDWTIKMINNNYTYASLSQDIEINSGSFDVCTSDYDNPSAPGHTVTVNHSVTKYASDADKALLKGAGKMSAFGNGTLKFQKSANFTGGFMASNNVTVVANKGAYPGKGSVTFRDASTFSLVDSASGTVPVAGTLTMAAGTAIRIPTLSNGILPLSVGALAFDGVTDEAKVALNIEGGALVAGYNAIIKSASALPEDAWDKFAVTVNAAVPAGMSPLYVAQGNTLYIVLKGENDAFWTGEGEVANFNNAANWMGGQIPSSGACVHIAAAGETTLICDIPNFSPSSITFPDGSEPITIAGSEEIAGIVAVTNLSATTSHTISVPVRFAGDIQVKQAAMAEMGDISKAHVTFAGGAYAAEGYALENGDFTAVYSRCVFGKYYLAPTADNQWTAAVQDSGKRICLGEGSSLYVPYSRKLTELYIGANAKAFVGDMSLDGRLMYNMAAGGEMVVTNMALSGTGDKYLTYNQGTSVPGVFKFNSITNSMSANWFYFADSNAVGKHTVYIGVGGLNFKDDSGSAAYCIGRNVDNNAETIRPWYSDFTIGARSTSVYGLVINRDATFLTDDESGVGRTITINAITRANGSPSITVSGSGTLKVNNTCNNAAQPPVSVTDTATLAIKPGATLGTGATTVNGGATLAVAESGTVALGGDLTLKAGAQLGFNYSNRNEPVLDLTGKSVTFDEGETTNVVVKVSADAGRRAKSGRNVVTTGYDFTGVGVTIAAGTPDWVKGVSVVDGDIVIDTKPLPTKIIIR